jgi:UDP-N-acetylmuramoylalanine--D-glutamate ligase
MHPVQLVDELKKHTHLLLGLGVENQALGRFFVAQGIRFAVADAQQGIAVQSLQKEWRNQVLAWHLGPDYLEHLSAYTRIWRTPGMAVLHPALQAAQQHGAWLDSQTQLFFALAPTPILGVTGTKGKGTTTMLLAAALAAGPFDKVHIGGNIGTPPIAFLNALEEDHLALLELSSFQLQDLNRSPHIGVVLRITQDHLDYHANRQEYIQAKQAICRHQTPADWLVFNQDCPQAQAFAHLSQAQRLSFSTHIEPKAGAWTTADQLWLRHPDGIQEAVCRLDEIPLRGRHNHENAAAAAAAALAAGATATQIGAGIRAFKGMPHRLEFVGEINGVGYYNDSLGTTPDAATAALQAFEEPLVLIAGGASKNADFSMLAKQICKGDVRALILLGEEGPRIKTAILTQGHFNGIIIEDIRSMAEAVGKAREHAQPGDIVLLSPACASFGMFTSYHDRGEQFKQAVL